MKSSEISGNPTYNPMKRSFETMMVEPARPSEGMMIPQSDLTLREQVTWIDLDVIKMAMKRNTIAHLDSGTSKTMIAIRIIKEVALSLKKQPSEKKLMIFLAPTRNLVDQQSKVLKENTGLMVNSYRGTKSGKKSDGKKVGEWDAAFWEHETSKYQIMVLTPQIFLDALRKLFLNFEMICLLVFDDCHYASGNHAYVSIMKEFYFKAINKPKVFGMTTSPIITKGASSAKDCEAQITTLESVLDSRVYTLRNRTEPEIVIPSSSYSDFKCYEPSKVSHSEFKTKMESSGAGTTKRKELHGTTSIRALSGTWGDKLDDGANFYAYKISFSCSVVDVQYSSFVLLVESELDDDVGNVEMELYLVSKFVKCKVSSSVKLHLNAQQTAKAKCFQELFFNGIFGKSHISSKQTLWTSSYIYLLLPLDSLEPLSINWKAIESSVSVVDFIKVRNGKSALKSTNSVMTDSNCTDMVHFANKNLHKDDIKEVVVLAIHTGKIYTVLELLENKTADSPFEGDAVSNTPQFSSFTDYFHKKYEVILSHPGQPMVLLKQSHKAHNLLVDFNGEGILHGKKISNERCKMNTDRHQYHARIPPELLVIIDAQIDVVKSFYLLPSLMHRLESLMLASQLREEISGRSSDLHISSSLILEAITTLRCNESFSMERLELLGDSVLKYAVSCDLYLRYPEKREGQLSSRRSKQVSNSTLHNLGIRHKLQGFIRDSAFDPTRWTAPGQLPLRRYPCEHGIEMIEVPIESKYWTEDPEILIGKYCDVGHRWMGSKTVSDCVEALIGAYFVGRGLTGALHCMNWLGVTCEIYPTHTIKDINIAAHHTYTPKLDDIEALESKLGYEFVDKGLLLEAITHSSDQEQGLGYCYERLEFLGDSVLDMLITWYLYEKHKDIDPGELTDLRSASVSNENFAYVAVRRNLHHHLQYRCTYLQSQIAEYETFVATSPTDTKSLETKKSPKALGDLVESIAGAILLDTKLSINEVWRIFEPLLSPIVTPDKLELPPLRELMELCDSIGYFMKETCKSSHQNVIAELRLQLKDAVLTGNGLGPTRKFARGQAALKLLKELEKRGFSRKNQRQHNRDGDIDNKNNKKNNTAVSNTGPDKNTKITLFDPQPLMGGEHISNVEIPVLESINRKKGGPRISLYELCKKMQWPTPIIKPSEQRSKYLVEIGEGVEKRTGFNIYETRISLTIPTYGVIELMGDPRGDKKSSFDSAALLMLYELQRLGKIKVG